MSHWFASLGLQALASCSFCFCPGSYSIATVWESPQPLRCFLAHHQHKSTVRHGSNFQHLVLEVHSVHTISGIEASGRLASVLVDRCCTAAGHVVVSSRPRCALCTLSLGCDVPLFSTSLHKRVTCERPIGSRKSCLPPCLLCTATLNHLSWPLASSAMRQILSTTMFVIHSDSESPFLSTDDVVCASRCYTCAVLYMRF